MTASTVLGWGIGAGGFADLSGLTDKNLPPFLGEGSGTGAGLPVRFCQRKNGGGGVRLSPHTGSTLGAGAERMTTQSTVETCQRARNRPNGPTCQNTPKKPRNSPLIGCGFGVVEVAESLPVKGKPVTGQGCGG